MLLSPELMRGLLLACMIGMIVLGGLFLRRRLLTSTQLLIWGTLLLLPLIGPFLVILLEPGTPRPRPYRPSHPFPTIPMRQIKIMFMVKIPMLHWPLGWKRSDKIIEKEE